MVLHPLATLSPDLYICKALALPVLSPESLSFRWGHRQVRRSFSPLRPFLVGWGSATGNLLHSAGADSLLRSPAIRGFWSLAHFFLLRGVVAKLRECGKSELSQRPPGHSWLLVFRSHLRFLSIRPNTGWSATFWRLLHLGHSWLRASSPPSLSAGRRGT